MMPTRSHAQIQQAFDSEALEQFVSERWQGIYVVTYRDGSPTRYFSPDVQETNGTY